MNCTARKALWKSAAVVTAVGVVGLMSSAFAGAIRSGAANALPSAPVTVVVDNTVDERLGLMLLIHRPDAAISVRGASK